MSKAVRYITAKLVIESGKLAEFRDIFTHVPKTRVAIDAGMHFYRINKIIDNPDTIKAEEIFLLSSLFDTDAKLIFDLVYNQHYNKVKGKRRK